MTLKMPSSVMVGSRPPSSCLIFSYSSGVMPWSRMISGVIAGGAAVVIWELLFSHAPKMVYHGLLRRFFPGAHFSNCGADILVRVCPRRSQIALASHRHPERDRWTPFRNCGADILVRVAARYHALASHCHPERGRWTPSGTVARTFLSASHESGWYIAPHGLAESSRYTLHMKSVIVGTAGHIDHGKTALVKALTGIDADRLDEEKRRGITIDIGFAHLELPGPGGETLRLGFVDVPGHERFVRNMLAGVGGIDLVLLVIAADESIKPQTREHFDICRLL